MLTLKNMITGELENVDQQNILKIENDSGKGVVFITKDANYKMPNSLDDWEVILFNDGFRLLDRSNIINMNQVNHYDSKLGKVSFYENSKVLGYVANIHSGYVSLILRGLRIGKIISEVEIEYTNNNVIGKMKDKIMIFKNSLL